MESKLKHLEMIQVVINRMASNSFVFKGWSITIVAGLTSFATSEAKPYLLLVSAIATVLFWAVDAYYLMMERAFRDLYKIVAKKDPKEINFLMNAPGISFPNWLKVLVTKSILVGFYLIVLLLIGATYLVVFHIGAKK